MESPVPGLSFEIFIAVAGAVVIIIIGGCLWCYCRRRYGQNLAAAENMKAEIQNIRKSKAEQSKTSLIPVENNTTTTSNGNNNGTEMTTPMSNSAARPGVDKTQSVQPYTPPTANTGNLNVVSPTAEESNDNSKLKTNTNARVPEYENLPSNDINTPNISIEISDPEEAQDNNNTQSPHDDERHASSPKENDRKDKKKKKKRSKNPELQRTTSRSRDRDNTTTENNRDMDSRNRNKSKPKNNETGNSKPPSPRNSKGRSDSLSISGEKEEDNSQPIVIQVSSVTTSREVEEEKKERRKDTNNGIPEQQPIPVRPKSNTDAIEPKPYNAKTSVESPLRQTQAQSMSGNKMSQQYIPPTSTSPRGANGPAFSSLVASGSLMVKEKESVLMDMDVAEVKELHKRSQLQLAGVQDNGPNEIQKTGQTLKEAIAAAQRQASIFSHKTGEEPNNVQTRPNENYRRTVGAAHDYVGVGTSNLSPQDDPHAGERHQHPGKNKMKSRRKQLPGQKLPPPPSQPPPMQPPPEYVDGYDSDESMYAPQFANALNNRSNRVFALDDSIIRDSQRDMSTAFDQLKVERGFGASKKRLYQPVQIGLPDKEGQLTEAEFYQKYWIEAGKLGEGSFARVRKITRKHDRRQFALKVIKKAGKSKEDLDALQKEIEILRKLNHKNVVRLTDWVDTKKRIHMVVEYCNGGDVFERILKQKTFSEWEASHVVRQVAEALEHIHSKGIVHRDLKPDNLMYLDNSPQAEIKIIDFGLAGDCSKSPLKTPCGTAHYVAPEVLSSIPYDTQADMWSLGVIIYMLLCGFPPFFDATGNQKRLYKLIKTGKYRFPSPYWDYVSDQAKDLIRGLLMKDPKERMSASQTLTHPWIEGKAIKKEMSDLYMEQMRFFQSSKHFTNMKIGTEEKQEEVEQKPVNIFAKQQYAYNYD